MIPRVGFHGSITEFCEEELEEVATVQVTDLWSSSTTRALSSWGKECGNTSQDHPMELVHNHYMEAIKKSRRGGGRGEVLLNLLWDKREK